MNLKLIGIIAILILCTAQVSLAQESTCKHSITGDIEIDNADSVLILNAILLDTEYGALVNRNGNFIINNLCKNQYTLQINYLGAVLLEKDLLLTSDTTITLQIDYNSLQLKEIDIKANGNARTTANKEKLTTDQIDQSRGLPLGEVLSKVNGVRTLKSGNTISKPIIHGLHSNRVLIYNNGIRQEGQQWGVEHAPAIDPFSANDISVVKGASSIKFGFDAIGGVVFIAPKKVPDSIGITSEINLAGMSNGRRGIVSGNVAGRLQRIKPLSFIFQGSLKRTGNLHTPNYYLKNTGVREYNFSTKLNWEKDNYGASFYYSQFNTDLGIFSGAHIGNLTDLQNAFERIEPIDTSGFSYLIDRPMQRIEHELVKTSVYFNTGEIGRVNIVYGRQYNLRYEYDKHLPLNDSLAELNQPELQMELTSHTLDVGWKHKAFRNIIGEIGVNGIFQKNTYTGRFFIPNYLNQGIGAYWIEKKKINKFLIEAGVRYDIRKLESFYWEDGIIQAPLNIYKGYAMNVGVKYDLQHNNTLSFNIAKTWRPPNVNELYSDGVHHGAAAVEIGSADMEKEQAISSNMELNLKGKKSELVISPYYNYFFNYIYLAPELSPSLTIRGAFPTFRFSQAEVSMYGTDIHFSYRLTKQLQYTLNASVLRAYNLSQDDYLIQMPADNVQNELSYQIPKLGKLKNSKISLQHQFVTEQVRVPINSDFAPPPPSYNLFGVMLSTQLNCKAPLVISAGVNNLFNTQYRDYMNRFRYYANELGRNFTIRLKMIINHR